ncbi:hypothetical protein EXU57_01425 [Segetibacter sp. 3557_3]|uniref:hypothetical protein n=1 Tax=Segetibacter sp. 3557_3 TaxID=2547429 RepID=UPI001058EBDE|nr:hypothetical protein [Segetibacter sp. 3557_3]TDH28760.1 hypothetical protein EXU57_01425 [Segetibacter sp. 3557_3]
MNYKILLLAFSAAVLTSCSTYKAGQTPDDVYYSPARDLTAKKEVRNEPRRDRYEEYISSQDDQYLRRKIRDRERWSTIDDYSYWYDSRYDHMDGLSYYRYNTWNQPYRYNSWAYNPWAPSYFGYGGMYSPAYPIVYYKNPRVYTGTTGKSNLTSFSNRAYSNQNSNSNNYNKGRGNENSNFGSLMKRVFSAPETGNANSQSNQSWDRPVRTMDAGSTPSSNAGGRSGGYNSTGTSTGTGRPPR